MKIYFGIAMILFVMAVLYSIATYDDWKEVKNSHNRDHVEVAGKARSLIKALISIPLSLIWPLSVPVYLLSVWIISLVKAQQDTG